MRIEPRRRRYNGISAENARAEDTSRPISGALPVEKLKHKKVKHGNKWVKLFALICMVHASRHFLFFAQYDDDYFLRTIRFQNEITTPLLRSSPRKLQQLDQTKWKRRRRTIPLSTKEDLEFSFWSRVSLFDHSKNTAANAMDDVISMDSTYPSFPITDYVVGDDVCKHGTTNYYNVDDRIMISGIFSHPVASELALTLAHRCGVRHLVGLSDHLLDTEESSRLEFLVRQIPNLQLRINKGPLGNRATQELFESFMPSHVFYFQSESFKITTGDNDEEESAFLTYSGSSQLEQICNTIVKIRGKSEDQITATSLLYVTSNLLETNESNQKIQTVTIVSKANQILLDAFRIQYQLDVRELNLPKIFGPYKHGAQWLFSKEFIHRASVMADHDQIQYDENSNLDLTGASSFNMNQPVISIADAIRSILVSGKLGHVPDYESIPVLATIKSQTKTLLNLSKTLLPLFTNSSDPNTKKKALDASLLPILSWKYKTTKPYQNPASFDASPIENDDIATLSLINTRHHLNNDNAIAHALYSQLERRQNNLFPCISVCASFVKCRPSIWDSIVHITKSVTEDCKYVLLVADFTTTLEELPLLKESTNDAQWPRDSFCQLAVVSSNSTIVKDAILKELENNDDEVSKNKTVEEWNGEVSSNGWTLVWIDEDDESISQADSLIPKIVPENILDPSVQYVFYVEPHHFKILPPLQIMWFLMSRQLSSGAYSKDAKSGTKKEWLIPERHIAFFTHAYNESNIEHLDPTKADYIPKAAKFILEQNGKSSKTEGDISQGFETTRQSKAYTNALTWEKEGISKFELLDTPLIIYPVHNARGRQFRCEWYEEQLFWSNEDNRYLEGLSLSYIFHRWRRRGILLRNTNDDRWGEMMLLRDDGEKLSPSEVEFRRLVDKEEGRKEAVSQSDPQHYLKVHSSLMVRKFYSYE